MFGFKSEVEKELERQRAQSFAEKLTKLTNQQLLMLCFLASWAGGDNSHYLIGVRVLRVELKRRMIDSGIEAIYLDTFI